MEAAGCTREADLLVRAGDAAGAAQLAGAGCGPGGGASAREAVPDSAWLTGRGRTQVVLDLADGAASAAGGTGGTGGTEGTGGTGGLARAARALDPDHAAALLTLAAPTALLLLLGGDDRQVPHGGRNGYGLAPWDASPRARLSSCTATPPDGEALAVADAWRSGTLQDVVRRGALPPREALRAPVAEGVATMLGLDPAWGGRVALCPSGTDVELLVAAVAAHGSGRPVTMVLLGASEAGSGTVTAAGGRYFRPTTPLGGARSCGAVVPGFEDGYEVVDVDVRDAAGRVRRPGDVEAEVEAHLEDAVSRGRTVVVHAMAGSKTGVSRLEPEWVVRWRAREPRQLRVLVDAAQGRARAARLRAFLAAGASISLTGSKALSGPPFSGALVLDDVLAADAARCGSLPAGLGDFLTRADLPDALLRAGGALQPVNLPLLARWHVALAERRRLAVLAPARRVELGTLLLRSVRARLEQVPGVQVVPDVDPDAGILCFGVRDGSGGLQGRSALVDVYRRVVSDGGVWIGQPVEVARGGAALLRAAVGAATLTRLAEQERPVAAATAVAEALAVRVEGALRERTRAGALR